jgi:nicotinamide-nucleotide amidase
MRQSYLPSRAIILKNEHGTASGMWMEKEGTVYVSLPGVPYEMKHLLLEKVLPMISDKFHCPFIYHKTLLTYGMGESEIAKQIQSWEEKLPDDLKLAYLPSFGRVRLRLSTKGFNKEDVIRSVDENMDDLKAILSDIAVGFEDETSIEQRIAELLVFSGQTLSVAESCTGGAIASKITEKEGASAYFMGSIIPYGTEFKSSILGIDKNLVSKFTVVSKEVAEAMAVNTKAMFKSDFVIATTGIAGPSKGDAKDEIGTVFIAIAGPERVKVERFSFGRSRERVIAKATNKAFEMLLEEIQKN